MIMVYDNGQSYSNHSIEFYNIDPLTIEECKRFVFLLGCRDGLLLPDETPIENDVPFIRGFVEKVEWFPLKYMSTGEPPREFDYNRIDPIKELVGFYYWFDSKSSLVEVFENIWDEKRRPTYGHMIELKSLLTKLGLDYPWFKEIK